MYDEAGDRLQSIADKVDSISRLVQSGNNGSCGSRVDVSGYEPLLGTFGEESITKGGLNTEEKP